MYKHKDKVHGNIILPIFRVSDKLDTQITGMI